MVWANIVKYILNLIEGVLEVTFSIATTPRCKGEHYSIMFQIYTNVYTVSNTVKYLSSK